MRVAIFGGTGFVGGYLVDALVSAGHEPSLLVRMSSANKVRKSDACRVVTGELSSKAAIDAALEDIDAVIYCVGILREYPKRGVSFQALQYDSVVRIAESAKSRGISRFLLMSASGVKEPGTPYQETKFRAEKHLKNAGFDLTVFRPSVIFGDPKGAMEFATQLYRDMVATPFPAVSFFTGWRPARGQVLMSPVHVEDVAHSFLRALEDASTIGKTFELGGPEVLSWSEMIRRIAGAVERHKWILPLPLSLMRVAATLFDWLPSFPVTRDQLKMLAEGNTVEPDVLEALVGRPPIGFIQDNLAYLRALS